MAALGLSRRTSLLGVAVLALVLALVMPLLASRGPAVSQPIGFSHRIHSEDLALACDFCHAYVRTGAHSGLPGTEICALCHAAPQGESEEAARLTALLADGEPLLFNKLFTLPDHVFYTHRRHVGVAELECVTCHGGIAQTERPPTRPLVRMTMEYCLDCHREQEQTEDCNACHR